MFTEQYKQELRMLRTLAGQFAEQHPSLAPLLRGPSADPDVERLLEGTAFLTADVRRKLDDEFPEILHALAAVVCPQHLQPVPASTIVAFTPRTNLKQTLKVAAGTHLDSVPVNGEPCRFRTCYGVDVAPLRVVDVAEVARPQGSGGLVEIRLSLEAKDVALDSLKIDKLRLYLGGELTEAMDLYALLTQQLREIHVEAGNRLNVLPASAIRPVGWGEGEQLLPRPRNSLPAFGALQDYFLFPEKYLFLDLDLSGWSARGGQRLEIGFHCETGSVPLPPLGRERFVLHAAPAVNLFAHEAEPLMLDHRQAELLLRPSGNQGGAGGQGGQGGQMWIFSVDAVEGIARGAGGKRLYRPFSAVADGSQPVYQTAFRPSVLSEGADTYLAVALPPQQPLADREILKVLLTCCNGNQPENLLPGDIRVPTRDTPELVDFTNLTAPTPARRPPLGSELMWQLIGHLSLNYLSLADASNLRSLLRHYAGAGDRARDLANHRRIDAITDLQVSPDERLHAGAFVRGQQLSLRWRADRFAGEGDKVLFGSILNRFFASCAAINSFTALSAEDSASGARIQWPAMLGTRPLI